MRTENSQLKLHLAGGSALLFVVLELNSAAANDSCIPAWAL